MEKYRVTAHKGAKNHAIAQGVTIVAHVIGNGYPSGEGWAQSSEDTARYLAHAANCHDDLLRELIRMVETFAPDHENDFAGFKSTQFKTARAAIKRATGDA